MPTADPKTRGGRWILLLALAALAWSPLVITGCRLAAHAVAVPFCDEWSDARFLAAAAGGETSWQAFARHHNESRPVLYRLWLWVCARGGFYDPRLGMALQQVILLATSLAVAGALRRVARAGWPATLLACGAVNLLLFSPAGSENTTWGFQWMLYVPALCLLASLAVNGSAGGIMGKAAKNALLCVAATGAFVTGLITWLLAWPRGHASPRRRAAGLALYAAALIATFALYFGGHDSALMPATESAPGFEPWSALRFALIWLGSPLAGSAGGAWFAGACGILAAGAVLALLMSRRQFAAAQVIASLGLYAILCGGGASLQRADRAPQLIAQLHAAYPQAEAVFARSRPSLERDFHFALEGATQSRYLAFSSVAWIALIVGALAVAPRGFGPGLVALLVAALLARWTTSWSQMERHSWHGSYARRVGLNGLVYQPVAPLHHQLARLFFFGRAVPHFYRSLREHDVFRVEEAPPSLAQALLRPAEAGDESARGDVQLDPPNATGDVPVRGWLAPATPDGERYDDAALIGVAADGTRSILAILPATLRAADGSGRAFEGTVMRSDIPAANAGIQLIGIRRTAWRVARVPGTWTLPVRE